MDTTDDKADHDGAKVDPNDIAKCALHHYRNKLSRGKPRPEDEWTVYAAIVAAAPDDGSLHVLSCATGSKCTTVGPDGWVLRDSHAEVLCRRGLIRLLLLQEQEGKLQLLEKRCNQGGTDRFKATTLHLYVSHSPCGDASIYPLLEKDMNFTGAKLIVRKSDSDSSHHNELLLPMDSDVDCCVAREATQELGVLRTKLARSNIPSHL
jgi:tRNA-specific adenosine deaminase 1